MKRLENKVVIVTGSTSGIGIGIARLCALEGADVVVCGRREEKGLQVVNKIKEEGGKAVFHFFDITKEETIESLIKDTYEQFGHIDVLVNNAANVALKDGRVDELTVEMWDAIFSSDMRGTFYATKVALPYLMKNEKGGSIINLDSVAGVFGFGGAAYASSKGAVLSLTKHTALRYAGKGIRCNAVCPSTIITPMTTSMDQSKLDMEMMGQMAKHGDLKVQPCMPIDVARVCLFLASDDSKPITGQIMVCDYGSTL